MKHSLLTQVSHVHVGELHDEYLKRVITVRGWYNIGTKNWTFFREMMRQRKKGFKLLSKYVRKLMEGNS